MSRPWLRFGFAPCLSLLLACHSNAGEVERLRLSATTNPVIVTLDANPTTGFQWSVLSYDKALFSSVTSKYLGPESRLIGAPGTMQFSFQRNSATPLPKETRIDFKYARSWESEGGRVKAVIVRFQQ